MLRIGFLTEPALSQILQSLRSFRMTERRIRNGIFLIAKQPLEREDNGGVPFFKKNGTPWNASSLTKNNLQSQVLFKILLLYPLVTPIKKGGSNPTLFLCQ
jgi:hypothetical protein